MEAIRVTDKEWEIAGVHYVRTEAMCNGFGVSLEMEFGEDKAGDEYILVLDGIHPVSTCRLHQLDENTGKIERVATLKEYRGQHYGAAAITAAGLSVLVNIFFYYSGIECRARESIQGLCDALCRHSYVKLRQTIKEKGVDECGELWPSG